MKIYYIKISLRGVSPMVWRRLRVPGTASLAMLHDTIQIINNWDDYNLHQFHIYGKDYGLNYDGAISYSDNAHKVYLDNFDFGVGDKFTYEYNFFEHIFNDIRIEDIKDILTTNDTISCISGSGMPGATKYDAMDVEVKFLNLLMEKKEQLTIADVEEFRENINLVKFNKKHCNNQLATLTT